jgi:uncharacterized protein involved in cysteine biosynthesis
MTYVKTTHSGKLWLYVILTLILLACLWVGWRELDPWSAQDEVRENIRSTIRSVIQVLVQYAIPGAIISFFGKEAYAKFRAKQRSSGNEA